MYWFVGPAAELAVVPGQQLPVLVVGQPVVVVLLVAVPAVELVSVVAAVVEVVESAACGCIAFEQG